MSLIFLDVETTGLDPISDQILEVGVVITNDDLTILDDCRFVIQRPYGMELSHLDPGCRDMHDANGLWAATAGPDATAPHLAEQKLIRFLKQYADPGKPPLCGSSVHFDRAVLKVHMPELHDFFSYKNIDVASIKELFNRWKGGMDFPDPPKPAYQHRVYRDCNDTINELAYYRTWAFVRELGEAVTPIKPLIPSVDLKTLYQQSPSGVAIPPAASPYLNESTVNDIITRISPNGGPYGAKGTTTPAEAFRGILMRDAEFKQTLNQDGTYDITANMTIRLEPKR